MKRAGVRCLALVPALVVAALLAPGCGPAPKPNVLLITIDTVRADRLGCYEHRRRNTTPHLDALADKSVLFEHAFANSSFTPPAHASILTSLYPSEHGLVHWSRHLADVPTAGDLFAAAGYRTAAFTPMATLFKLGLSRGFQETTSPPYHMQGDSPILADADEINAAALPFLSARGQAPFFAWVHYYDAHRPYARQGPEWSGRYTKRDEATVGATEAWYQLTPARRKAIGLTREQVSMLADHYDGGIAYLDDRLGWLLDALASAGVLEHTLLVVVADHGEVFDEHEPEWFSHDPYLVEENVHVPLLLRLPGAAHAGLRVPDLVQQVDVLPTLLQLCGIAPPAHVSGLSLVPLLEGKPLARSFVAAERQGDDLSRKAPAGKAPQDPPTDVAVRASRDRQLMVRTATRKLVVHEDLLTAGFHPVDGSAPESTDLSEAEPEALRAASDALRSWQASLRKASDAGQDSGLDDADMEFIARIGYAGGGGAPGDAPPADKVDDKTKAPGEASPPPKDKP